TWHRKRRSSHGLPDERAGTTKQRASRGRHDDANHAPQRAPERMESAIQLPKLNLGGLASHPKFLAPIDPPHVPFSSPPWCLPHKPRAISLLDVYKNHELLTTYTVDQKAVYLIGRNAAVCDIVLNHCSISRLHACIIHHRDGAAYLVDLGSCHGTFVDEMPLQALQPTLIVHGSVLKFGASSRSYSFKSFESRDMIQEIVLARIGLDPEEIELQTNTMLNRALSYRLGLSPPAQDEPMNGIVPPPTNELVFREDSADSVSSGPLFQTDEFGRKRSRAQSASTDILFGSASSLESGDGNTFLDASQLSISKRVHFSQQPADVIPPPVSPPADMEGDQDLTLEHNDDGFDGEDLLMDEDT
ncbi:TPA: hypothetical protein N0F65_003661, partial [Lagenidium giganteum]